MYFTLFSCTAFCFFSSGGAESSAKEQVESGMFNFGQNLAVKLFEQAKPDENVLVSPPSVYGALALLLMGAADVTKDELSQSLGFTGDDEQLRAFNEGLENKFLSVSTQDGNAPNTMVRTADGIFIANNFQVKKEYRDQVLGRASSSVVENVDFNGDPKGATDTINKYIAEQTNGRVPALFPQPLDSSTFMILATSLYFKSPWRKQFSTSDIEQKTFTTSTGDIQVAFLKGTRTVPYFKNDALKFEAISIPYESEKFHHYVILPAQDSDVGSLVRALNADEFNKLVQEAEKNIVQVALEMPKLKYDYNKSLNEALKALGMNAMFEKANLSKMIDQEVTVSEVTHATTIDVNEYGTEAAAVTAVQLLGATGASAEPLPFVVNRAFVFVIYDSEEKMVLFNGVVNKP